MALPLPSKPAAGTSINTGHSIASGLVRCVLLNEGSGTATELVGSGAGTLTDAAWGTDSNLGGTVVEFGSAATTRISYGVNGLSHGNGDVSVFFAGRALVDGAYHLAGAIAGNTTDTLQFGIEGNSSNKWVFTLRTVWDIVHTGTQPVNGNVYTVGMAYDKGVSVRFHIYNHTAAAQITPETVNNTDTPVQLNNPSLIGNMDTLVESWREDLAFLYVWNRVLSDGEFETLHANPYVFFGSSRFFLMRG